MCPLLIILFIYVTEKFDFAKFDLEHIVTPVRVKELHELLLQSKYDQSETNFIINGFTNGFPIGYNGPKEVRIFSPNLKLECGTKRDLWNKVTGELKLNRYAGPFKEPPHEHFIQSPIELVPKGETGTRLIFHLSYPRGSDSVNSLTPQELCTVHYKDLDFAVRMCMQEGPGCYVTKSDMSSAFRNPPIRPQDWCWLTLMARHPETNVPFYFVDKCLPFGSSISCSHFQ